MTDDEKIDRYLYDPAAPPAAEVEELERVLAPLRYDPAVRALPVPHPRSFRRVMRFAAAAAVIATFLIGGAAWIWTWPSDRDWSVVAGPMASMPVGKPVKAEDSFLVRVARIGWMHVTKGSELTLLSTRTNRHRLVMNEGVIHVSVWAPPRSVAFRTPAGDVVDFGCEFVLRVERGVTDVNVVSGWVQLDHRSGELLVPGGASSHMTASARPSVPLFATASPRFKEAMSTLDGSAAGTQRQQALIVALAEARRRDVYSLLILARRAPAERDALLARAAALVPPRPAALVARARGGDDDAIDEWVKHLPLPPTKGWLRNWRDRLLVAAP